MLKGKKLLVLGASSNEISLVQRAQELGVYVIVTDYNIDYKLSPAKKFANEAWNISWSDLNSLEKLCKENNVNGVIAGYSEFRVENMILLCERLGLPCYLSMKQLEITRDKIKFKEECRKNNVPVVNEYNSIDEVNKYPVIVKPVDRAGSIGISIATNKIELIEAYEYAMEKSICKKVIIEDFIQEVKFDAYYSIVNGDITLLSTDDVIYAKNNGFEKVVQSGWVLPSKNHDNFIRKEDAHLKSMIKNMGIMNGYIFFSGFMNKSKDFVFFECGFRLCGGHLYNYFPEIGMYNNMDIFIYHSLLGNLCSLEKKKKYNEKLKCVTINLYSKKGKIDQIKGFDDVKKIEDCKFSLQQCYQGQECSEDAAILSKIGVVYFCNESAKKLKTDVDQLYSMIKVKDKDGNNMIYDKVDSKIIESWWND